MPPKCRIGPRPLASVARLAASITAFLICLAAAQGAHAHATGENYVWLNVAAEGHLEGRFEISPVDLEETFGLEIPDEEAAALAVVEANRQTLESYLAQRFEISAAGEPVAWSFTGVGVSETPGIGYFAQYHYRSASLGEVPDQLEIRNEVLTETDRFHRSLLCIEFDQQRDQEFGEEFTALIFSQTQPEQTLDLTDIRSLLRVRDFVWQGVLHIWIGIDHVLFLIALLFTAVLAWGPPKEDGGDEAPSWQPVASFKIALINIVTIVTTFTIAHSITLSLAALDIISLSSRWVESIIALSIVLVALNNLRPVIRESWVLIFFFGLFHGMGFASVMGELPFRMMNLVQVILAFNIGVELGQLAIVLVAFPILFLMRDKPFYRPVVLYGGSIAIALISLWWFIERAFAL